MTAHAACDDCQWVSKAGTRRQAEAWARGHWCDQRWAREFRELRLPKQEGRHPAGSFTHGMSGYTNYKCRCNVCRGGFALSQRRSKARRTARLAADPTLALHGKASTYGNWGCRCMPCTDAHTADTTQRRARQKDAAA